MKMKSMHKAAELIWKLMEGDPEPAVLPMRAQKIPFRACKERSSLLPRSTPEAEGVDPEILHRFIEKAAADREENLHSLTVLRHGRVIAEHSFAPYDREIWHVTHSMCKTITALAVGILIGEGKLSLEEKVVDIFPGPFEENVRERYGQLTVYHLLTMTSGVSFCEMQSVTESNWIHGFLHAEPLFSVGEKFHYNSMNTYMLSAILCEKTGMSLTRFVQEKLFDFMGIRQFHWETCPMGIEKGGWGLFLLQEDVAKLGQLILNRGKWNGKQLVPEKFIGDMCSRKSNPPQEMGRYGYGYQCWLWERPGSIRLSGLFGQNVLVIPDRDMVIALNAGSGRMFGESRFLHSCAEFAEVGIKSCSVKGNYITQKLPVNERKGLSGCGEQGILRMERCYRVHTGSARVLPVFMQLMENSYTTGLTRVRFLRKGTTLYIALEEGACRNGFAVGFSGPIRGEIRTNGEIHTISVAGHWTGKKGKPVLHVEVAFLEQASTRHMDFLFESENILRIRLTETPDKTALLQGAGLLFDDPRLVHSLSEGRLRPRLDALAEPKLLCIREK